MSADIVREAAALMRSRAEAASLGRWVKAGSSTVETDHNCCNGHDCRGVAGTWRMSRYPRPAAEEADATHIAAADPTVMLAVADWLGSAAENRTHSGEPLCCHACIVARAYLRSDQ